MTGETVWLDDLVERALREGCDVRLALDGHSMGFHVVIDGEAVTDYDDNWGLPWETLTAEIPVSDDDERYLTKEELLEACQIACNEGDGAGEDQ